jgi:hypothetical protein
MREYRRFAAAADHHDCGAFATCVWILPAIRTSGFPRIAEISSPYACQQTAVCLPWATSSWSYLSYPATFLPAVRRPGANRRDAVHVARTRGRHSLRPCPFVTTVPAFSSLL